MSSSEADVKLDFLRRPIFREHITVWCDGLDRTDIYFSLLLPQISAPRLLNPAMVEEDLARARCSVLLRPGGLVNPYKRIEADSSLLGRVIIPPSQVLPLALPTRLGIELQPSFGSADITSVPINGRSLSGREWTIRSSTAEILVGDVSLITLEYARSVDERSWHMLEDDDLFAASSEKGHKEDED